MEDLPDQNYEPALYNWQVRYADGALLVTGQFVHNDAPVRRDDITEITCDGLKSRPRARTSAGGLIVLW